MRKILSISLLVLSSSLFTLCSAQYHTVWNFQDTGSIGNANGAGPNGSLIGYGKHIYGMTSRGGSNNMGVIFSVDTDGTNYKDLLDFNGTNGSNPGGVLTQSGKHLYGMTESGGSSGTGIVFSIDTDGSNFKDLADFGNYENPYGSLIISGKHLYGMTNGGGLYGYGSVFVSDTDGNNFTDLLDFSGVNGYHPYGDLTLSNGKLFGMTYEGAANNFGDIFTIDTNGNNFKDLLDFNGSTNGAYPYGSLIISGAQLFGMTYYGVTGYGNVFSIDTAGNNLKELYDFNGTDGNGPAASLTLLGSTLYGMTGSGGVPAKGNIFSIDTTGSGFADIYDFDGVTAANPNGNISLIGNSLYGFTTQGDPNNAGVIFKYHNPLCTLTLSTTAMENVSCNGGNNGIALATPAGGTSPYTYSWSPGGETTQIISNLIAGTYTVTVFDNGGCFAVGTVTITEPNALTVTANLIMNVSCNGGNNGSADAMPSGGTAPFTYSWAPSGGTNQTENGLSAGTYTINVMDSCGNSATTSVLITEPNMLTVTANTSNDVFCHGNADGHATATPSDGTMPYTYLWSGAGGTMQTHWV